MSTLSDSSSKVELVSRTPEILPEELVKEDVLGEGSFGIVYKGTCRGKAVAIKELTTELDEKTIREFKKECEILMVLRHSNIVTFMGACVERNNLAFVTELLDGDLDDFIKSGRKISLLQKLKMMRDMAQGMAWLHASDPKIIHRDLKPKNILMDRHLNVKICDFGLSLMIEKKEKINTRAGSFIWMAPEALLKTPHNEKVDVYSYGIVCWQILTNSPQPYQEYLDLGSLEAFIDAVCKRKERPPLGDLPKSVKTIVRKLWDHDPDNRPGFETVIQELNAVMLECALIYEEARNFWKFYYDGKISVPFDDFARDLSTHLNLDIESEKNLIRKKCLEAIICKEDEVKARYVTLDRFGLVLKWFGPLTLAGESLLEKIVRILKNDYFHGEVSKKKLEVYNKQYATSDKKKSFYLLRFSETEPIEEHPFSITVWKGGSNINHRINYNVQTGLYSVSFKDKKDSNSISDKDLCDVIKICSKPLKLKTEIIGDYSRLFLKEETAELNYS
jgi:serine/threonine protein kinase